MNAPLPAPAATRQTNIWAVVSLICGILGLSIVPLLGSIIAIITGHMACKDIQLQPDRYDGKGLAIVGLVLGYVVVVGSILAVLGVMLFFGGLAALLAWTN